MSINSISPIDGRYSTKTSLLSPFFSEKGLIKYRIMAEVNYLLLLSGDEATGVRKFSEDEIKILKSLYDLSDEDAMLVKQIEMVGHNDIPATNHDVKAVEYFIKLKLEDTSLADVLEIVHFALTSEDINNSAYGLMLKDGLNNVILPSLMDIYDTLYNFALSNKDLSMLARTHGQPASPTTFGKEILVFVSRIKEELALLRSVPVYVKLNGATGNFNAHVAALDSVDWVNFSKKFVAQIGEIDKGKKCKYCGEVLVNLKYNPVTTQIEPHDGYSRIFDLFKRINTILIDFSQDIWRYISDGWIKQRAVKGEIGSSAMPHKVNPIDFENAEGNFGMANAMFNFFSSKLSISRLQRDLSDSTVLRNVGTAFAHSLIAYQSMLKGLSKIEVNKDKIAEVLNDTPEVMAEAYQNILCIEGVEKPYELLKEITRGKKVSVDDFHNLVKKLNISEKTKAKLLSKSVLPSNYIGLAGKIVEDFDPSIIH